MEARETIILFDGVCNLCNGMVRFLIPRDPKARLRFASQQSAAGQQLLKKCELPTNSLDSVVVLEGDHIYTKSTAALKIARNMNGLWPLLYGFILVPRFIRDPLYDWVARNRYRWFGTTEACLFPSPEVKCRFLE